MEENKELLTELMRYLQKKYIQVNEIGRITKELGDALSGGDRESIQMLLRMRQSEIEKASETERAIRTILNTVDPSTREGLKKLLNVNSEVQASGIGPESQKIMDLSSQVKRSLARTVEIDRVISRKLAGSDSYYAKAVDFYSRSRSSSTLPITLRRCFMIRFSLLSCAIYKCRCIFSFISP